MKLTDTENIIGLKLDKWQKSVLEYEGHICIRAGRQIGKSTVIAIKAHDFALQNPGTVTLVIAASQRQSSLLFSKMRQLFDEEASKGIYAELPTLTKIILTNGSRIYCVPTGKSGIFIRGFTIDLLIADEASYIPEPVWLAVMPMLAVSRKKRGKGFLILLSTPCGKGGFFYECSLDDTFKQFHITSEQCERIPKEFLLKEKRRLSKVEYAQEYLAEFIDEWNQFFETKLIVKCETFIEWTYEKEYKRNLKYSLGVDIARYGGDKNAFVVAEMMGDRVRIVKAETTERVALTDTIGRIKALDEKFKFNKIFIDDAGIGGGVYDVLEEEFGRRIIGLNNAKRSVDTDARKKQVMKEDLYSNALVLMENHEAGREPSVEMISNLALRGSLKGMTYEYSKDKILRIHGKDSHLAEAFVRACWCIREKSLKLFIA